MIKMSYDPIMGVRYVTIDIEPRTEEQRVISARASELYRRTCRTHTQQMRRANNTKTK